MSTLRQAAQQALEFLKALGRNEWGERTALIERLEAALAKPEQEPVAWMCPDDPDRATAFAWRYGYCIDCGKPRIPLYTASTPRKPLTPDQVFAIADQHPVEGFDPEIMAFVRAIERAHGIGEQT